MKIDLEFAELHSPLFITHDNGGTNFGEKLYIDPKRNLKGALDALYYDTDLRHTVVMYRGKVALIENIASMTLKDPDKVGLAPVVRPVLTPVRPTPFIPQPGKAQVGGPGEVRLSAQVSTPIDKVQGKPGRKAKFQGEETQGE